MAAERKYSITVYAKNSNVIIGDGTVLNISHQKGNILIYFISSYDTKYITLRKCKVSAQQ